MYPSETNRHSSVKPGQTARSGDQAATGTNTGAHADDVNTILPPREPAFPNVPSLNQVVQGPPRAAAGSSSDVGGRSCNIHADTLLDLAEVLRAAGRESKARVVTERALGLYERKGNVVSAKWTRSRIAELAVAR